MFQRLITSLVLACCLASTLSAPIRREVPQEHSHEPFLTSVRASLALNNPDGIVDPVFGLLGNAAAAQGAGKISDPTCLQQATADQAFTNAKAAGDVQGQVDALIFRALERNSGSVGLATDACTSIKAVNPEIAAIQQHQDPASANAAVTNKAITLELARQIAAVGGDPQDALKAGTFAPGTIGDPTAKGNTCNVADDPDGCIFTQNLLVPDASADEIDAAVAGIDAGGNADNGNADNGNADNGNADNGNADNGNADNGNADNGNADNGNADTGNVDDAPTCPPSATVTVTVGGPVARATAAPADNGSAVPASAPAPTGNLQAFTGAVGGAAAPAVTVGGRGFLVEGSDSFLNQAAAIGRSCDIQHNACADIANSAAGRAQGLTVGQCDQQNNQCKAAA